MRYFICNTTTPYTGGSVNSAHLRACEVFINRKEISDEVLSELKRLHPNIILIGTPIIDFIYELTKEEYLAFTHTPSSDQEAQVSDTTESASNSNAD